MNINGSGNWNYNRISDVTCSNSLLIYIIVLLKVSTFEPQTCTSLIVLCRLCHGLFASSSAESLCVYDRGLFIVDRYLLHVFISVQTSICCSAFQFGSKCCLVIFNFFLFFLFPSFRISVSCLLHVHSFSQDFQRFLILIVTISFQYNIAFALHAYAIVICVFHCLFTYSFYFFCVFYKVYIIKINYFPTRADYRSYCFF